MNNKPSIVDENVNVAELLNDLLGLGVHNGLKDDFFQMLMQTLILQQISTNLPNKPRW